MYLKSRRVSIIKLSSENKIKTRLDKLLILRDIIVLLAYFYLAKKGVLMY